MKTMQNALTASILVAAASTALGQADFRTIAVTGQPAPGLSGVTLEYVSDPKLDPTGKVAFWARLAGAGVTNDNAESIWTDRSGSLALAYRSGIAAPNTTGTLGGMSSFNFTRSGLLAFVASIYEGTSVTPNAAYYSETAPGSLALLVREPFTPNLPALNGLLPVNGDGLTAWSTSVAIVTAAGITINATTPVPGVAPSLTFRRMSEPTVSGSGNVVFRAFYGATTASAEWQHGLFVHNGTTLAALAQTGAQVPGFDPGVTFAELSGSSIVSPAGSVHSWVRVQGPGVTATNASGIFRQNGGGLELVVKIGTSLPAEPTVTLASIGRNIGVLPDGSVVFQATLAGATTNVNNTGIFIAEPGQPIRTLVRRGQYVYGLPQGTALATVGTPHVSEDGHIIFSALVTGGGASGQALIAADTLSPPQVVARTGGYVGVNGDPRQIRSINFGQQSEDVGHSQILGRSFAATFTFEDRTTALLVGTLGCSADFNSDGDIGTDADIEAFFACLAGNCCPTCAPADFNRDGDIGDDADIEAFFRVLAGGHC